MSTTNNKCKKCGCEDSFMTSPAPCPTPEGCPTPEPCSEVMDSQCVIYTGANIECGQDTVVTTNDTVAEAIENIVDYFCSNQPVKFQYEIGQYVEDEGGVIAHRWLSDTAVGSPTTGSFQNYLVVDTNDLSTGAAWGLVGTNVSNCESTWDGLTNTASIISAGAAFGTASVLCNNSTNNGKSDWYLPATDELSKIFQNRWDIAQGITIAGGTQLTQVFYVGSTEIDANNAWGFGFNFGMVSTTNKGNDCYVRAVRKFSI